MTEEQKKIDDIIKSKKYPIQWFDTSKVLNRHSKSAYCNGMPIGIVTKAFKKEAEYYLSQPLFPCAQDVLNPNPSVIAFNFTHAKYYIEFHFVQFMELMHSPQLILDETKG